MIYTISSIHSFSDLLAQKLIEKSSDDVWGMSKTTIILPTRRAVKTLKEAFLRQSEGKTFLLPKMVSLADMDILAPDIKEPISSLERQLILMQMIIKKTPVSPDKALRLAGSLAAFLDEMESFEVPLERLFEIVPDSFAEHWQETLSFLEIIRVYWPEILKEKNKIDPALHQIQILRHLIAQWQKNPPQTPFIAAGFTGGLPIVETFLKTLANLPKGDVILPHLDLSLDEDTWNALDETHPQFQFKRLLKQMDVKVSDVIEWEPISSERSRLISMALLPATRTYLWNTARPFSQDVLQNITRIDCKGPESEALAIALELRRVLETPGKTAALVTNDRNLSRRVISEMKRWNITLDDSAGTPLSKTPTGIYLILMAEAAVSQKATDLLALLKHPLATDGSSYTEFRRKIHLLEKQARKSQTPFHPHLQTDLQPFFRFFINPVTVPFALLLKTHLQTAEALATSLDKTGAERLWKNEDGEASSALLTELMELAEKIGEIEPIFYPAFLTSLLETISIRPKYGMHPRLDILGPIEARLQHPDVVIIGGMNEGTFPKTPESDPWLNRPMRSVLGLPLPEEMIGLSAHDFSHIFMAPSVILTRSLKVDGTPTIPSRWLLRLEAVLKASQIPFNIQEVDLSCLLTKADTFTPAERPAPTPPIEARPQKLSITAVETWMRDPYSIYARYILGLKPLPELDEDVSIREYGNAVHAALEQFLSLTPPSTDMTLLLQLGDEALRKNGFNEATLAFWKPKFERTAKWFIERQKERLARRPVSYLEKKAELTFETPTNRSFTLYGKADRVDVFPEQKAEIIDYKTGTPPSNNEVEMGYAPQLVLEGILLQNNAFEDIPAHLSVSDLAYWRLTGRKAGGEIASILPKRRAQITPEVLIEAAMQGLRSLINAYEDPQTPYPSCPRMDKKPKYNDYEHLARTAEWINGQEEQDG